MKSEILLSDVKEAPILYTCARDENIAPGTRFGPIMLDLYIVECCTEGSGSVIINDKELPFKSGDCYVLQPGQKVVYTSDSVTSRRGVWCAIDGIAVSESVSELGVTDTDPFVPRELFPDIESAICSMIDSKEDTDMGAKLRCVGALYNLIGALLKNKSVRDKNIWVEKAMGFIEANYYKHISVEDIASEIGLERAYFSTLFKACTGVSPHAYLSEVRIKKAAILIKDRGYSVSDAAEMVGLDVQNFARLFKKTVGKNPRDYKKQKLKL